MGRCGFAKQSIEEWVAIDMQVAQDDSGEDSSANDHSAAKQNIGERVVIDEGEFLDDDDEGLSDSCSLLSLDRNGPVDPQRDEIAFYDRIY
jgi:hypothetical protein